MRSLSEAPSARRVVNISRECACGLTHEVSASGHVVRVVCSCGRVVWAARPRVAYNNAPAVRISVVEGRCGHRDRRPWCGDCRDIGATR